jgi:hypothetical protein
MFGTKTTVEPPHRDVDPAGLIPLSHLALDLEPPPAGWPDFLVGGQSGLCLMIWVVIVFAAKMLAGCWMNSVRLSSGGQSCGQCRKRRRSRLTSCGARSCPAVCPGTRFPTA